MATIKFSEFDAGNINIAGAQLVGLTGGNSATNARFTASDLVNGLATVTYVDTQDAGLQSQITQNTNDILAIANNEANITTLQGQVSVLEGKVVVLEGNIVTLENSVTVNSDDIIVIQGQIADLQANGNIQLLSLDNSSNVLSISGGNTVDFTTVLAGGGGGGIESVTGGTNITTVPSGSDVTVNLDPNISVSSLSATGNIDVGNINVDDCILLGSGTGGSITGAESISAQSLLAIGNLNVAGYLVDGIIDDDTLATASATTLATSESVKAYVDANAGGGNPFDQNLNTTDSPTFDNLSTTGELDVNGSGTHTFEGTLQFTQLTNFGGVVGITSILDEDNMTSNSATALATQQSIKAYVDAKPTSGIAIGNVTVEPTAALQSIAIGEAADASVAFAIAIGKNSSAPNNFGIAIGENTTVGLNSVALGYNAEASTSYTTALGWAARAIGPASTALGHECEATSSGSIAIGSDSTVSATAGLAIGYKSDVQAAYSTSIGWQNDISTTGAYTVSIGSYPANNTYTEPNAIKIAAGSTSQTQVEVRPNYLDLSSTGFGIACNASVGFTFTDAINGNVTLSSLIGGGGGGSSYGNANVTAYAEAGWAGNIIPSANVTYDLGSETNRWKDLWLSGNTIHLGDTSISADDGALSVDGLALENTYAITSSVVNTATEVYNSNGVLPADPKGMAVADPSGAGGWYWSSPGTGASPIGLNSFQWKMFNNNGPQTYTVADVEYLYMIVDLYTVGQVYFNIYTGTGPIATTFTSRFSFTLNGDFASTGRFLMWAKPPGSTTTVDDVEMYPFLERLELPYAAVASSGPLLTSEPIKSVNVQTRTSPALTAGEVEFNLKNVGYKVKGGYIQNFDMDIYNPFDQGVSTTDTPEFQGVTATTGTVRLASLTTTERDNLTPVNGDMIYNTTDSKLQGYQAGVWVVLDGS